MTATQRIELQPAFLLHSRPYRNTSLLLDIFSPEYGKLTLVGRGVANKQSMKALLRPFQPLLLSWTIKGDMGNLVQAEMASLAYVLSGNKLLSAFYLNELLQRLLHQHDPHADLFSYYQNALEQLVDKDNEIVLRYFEKLLLEELGYGLVLDCDMATGQPIEATARYQYFLDKGPMRIEGNRIASLVVSGQTLIDLSNNQFSNPERLKEMKSLMRAVLSVYLGNKPLKSREMFVCASKKELSFG